MLVVLIAILGIFIYLKVQVAGDVNSNFNQTTRYTLGKYELVRRILGMHSYGDARNAFLNTGDGGIVIEVVQAKGSTISDEIFNQFIENIKTVTGKSVLLYNTELISSKTLSDSDLEEVVSGYRRHAISGQANLFVIYANDFNRTGTEVAKTYKEFGIILSDKRLKEVTSQYPNAFKEYVESTLLHEFGHQLGMEHNDRNGCVMNEKVESPTSQGFFFGTFTQTQFCDFELKQLNEIKASLQ